VEDGQVTHVERVYELLSDGKPHSHHEGYALGVILHSRISDLRRRGIQIRHWRENGTSYYQLGSELTEREPFSRELNGASRQIPTDRHDAPSRSVSSSDQLAGTGSETRRPLGSTTVRVDTATPLFDGVPVPANIVGQLSLEAA
jgi:hypothetical protein